ncbi:MAG: hypothetical protein ABI410_21055, partial [Rhodoferax sp.]
RAFTAMLADASGDYRDKMLRAFVQSLGPGQLLRVSDAARAADPADPFDIFRGCRQWTLPTSAPEPDAAIAHCALAFFSGGHVPIQ